MAVTESKPAIYERTRIPSPIPSVLQVDPALREALKDPEVKGRLTSMGAEISSDDRVTSDALRAQVASEVKRWKETISKAGIVATQ